MSKDLYLGTAGWGMRTSKREAHQILDDFVSEGFSLVDSSTNYPIDGVPSHHGLALSWLDEWLMNNQGNSLRIFIKIGSLSNSREDEFDLSEVFIKETFERLQAQLGKSVYGIGIHWDNRDMSMISYISDTIKQLKLLTSGELRLGLSGIRHPDAYKATGAIEPNWLIQVKEFLGDIDTRQSYSEFFPDNEYVAYGLSHYLSQFPKHSNLQRKEIYFRGLDHILNCEQLRGVVFGPSNRFQAQEVMNHVKSVEAISKIL